LFFSNFDTAELSGTFSTIECEIEHDLSVIDEILFRRHTGSQDGVGQSQWDPEGKSNFLQRTGKDSVGLGQTIEKILKAEQLLPQETELPWSNLERLLSSETLRKRAGISFARGSLVYLGNKADNLLTLQKIATTLVNRKLVLGDIWNNTAKNKYLDQLKSAGFAIDRAPMRLATPADSTPDSAPPRRIARRRPTRDKNVISKTDYNPFVNISGCERAESIWRELQFDLEFEVHENAIAVLMRVLLDLAITFYAREQGIALSYKATFAQNTSRVADSMLNRGLIDDKARSIVRKFESDKPLISAHSMHQYVHNPSFHPSESDLRSIWNVIRSIIINSTK
jgi:hypothetical protein